MLSEIPKLDEKGLRSFGLTTGALFVVLFGLVLPWLFEYRWPIWPWIIFLILSVPALISPKRLGPIYTVWMRFGLTIGAVMSYLILGVVFFIVLTPIGLLMRATGKDTLRQKLDKSLTSYREPIDKNKSNSFREPF